MGGEDIETSELSRSHIVRALAINLLLLPAILLAILYGISLTGVISFDILIFILTATATIALISGWGWGQRSAASSREGVLIQRADQSYVKDISEGRSVTLPTKPRIIIVIVAATVLGWLILIVSYLGYLPEF